MICTDNGTECMCKIVDLCCYQSQRVTAFLCLHKGEGSSQPSSHFSEQTDCPQPPHPNGFKSSKLTELVNKPLLAIRKLLLLTTEYQTDQIIREENTGPQIWNALCMSHRSCRDERAAGTDFCSVALNIYNDAIVFSIYVSSTQ